MSQKYCTFPAALFAHEYFVCEDMAREKHAFFLIPVFRCKESLPQYTYMFSFTFVPFVFHSRSHIFCSLQR